MGKDRAYNEKKWELLCEKASACKDCILHFQAKQKVICDPPRYEGIKDVLFIGEGPGENEDEQGIPFVGLSGQFLRKMIAMIGLPRDAYAITNVVMCRPPGNRDPQPYELQECKKWLIPKIRMLKPVAIVTLGKHATQEMLGHTVSILSIAGRPKETSLTYGSINISLPMMPLPHPRWGQSNVAKYEQLFGKMDAWLKGLGVDERDPAACA